MDRHCSFTPSLPPSSLYEYQLIRPWRLLGEWRQSAVSDQVPLFQIILLLLMLFMRKRVALTIALFHVAGKVFIHLPLLTLQPFVTFLALLLFWIYWILVLLFLGTTGQLKNLLGSRWGGCSSGGRASYVVIRRSLVQISGSPTCMLKFPLASY